MKYIIDLNPDCVEGEYLRIPARIAGEEQWLVTKAALTPYTEPDLEQVRKEAYQRGYCDALEKHCEICEEKHDAEEAYQKGLSDAWDAARKIWENDIDTLHKIFGWVPMRMDVFLKFTASEVIEKLKAYEQEKEEQIQVGDEVVGLYGTRFNMRGFVTKANNNLNFNVVWDEGDTGYYAKGDFRKTGRHFPELVEVMQKMKEGE